ncbi:hypothetical protein HYC85_015095 [Camellia sinensis]|uniref:Uncharacterized protein n=1 Tax=Camellia sinensis TaxID=4442 RepID=A0A7J7HBD5_CAMSI|nr:hypothetical protein HYC85_015095 [Camellia sinensis]
MFFFWVGNFKDVGATYLHISKSRVFDFIEGRFARVFHLLQAVVSFYLYSYYKILKSGAILSNHPPLQLVSLVNPTLTTTTIVITTRKLHS